MSLKMGASNEELLHAILYYQKSLDKYTSFGNNYKLMSIIEKLKRLPIATAHLEETGIGRTVNALRKLGGDVGDAAKGLVARWKDMVVKEEGKAKENEINEPASAERSSENDVDSYEEKESSCIEEEDTRYQEKESSSQKSSYPESKSSENHEKNINKYSSNNTSGTSYEKKDNESKKRTQDSDSSSDDHSSKRRHDSSGFESEEDIHERNLNKSNSKRRNKSDSSEEEEEEDQRHKSKKNKHSKDSSDSEDGNKKQQGGSKSSRNHSSSKSKSKEKTESKRQDYESSSDREEDKPKHRSNSKSKRDSDCEESKSSSKHRSRKSYNSSSDNEDVKHKSKHDSRSRHEKESSKSKDSKSHSSRSDKHEKKDKKESKRGDSKEKTSHKKEESPRKSDEKHKKSKDERENSKKEKTSSSKRMEESSKSSGSKHKSSSEKKSKDKSDKTRVSAPASTEKIKNGIDSGSGASFAEALGMCGSMVSKSSSSSSTKKKSSSAPSAVKPRSSSSYVAPEKADPVEEDTVPILLKEQPPEPLNINLSSLLPEITPNYRPVGFPMDSQPKRLLSQDEALSQVISNKNMRTKVYSGNKSFGKVETLFDLCVRILQDNIDALEYTGGVPYHILKPVLEKATPDQLFNMEHHNPYLIEETDELWLLHCQKEFRNKKREELESWREMYMRCLDEREARLNAITANIKQSQDKSTPIRTTKLAYIDSVVKPPRNIARKQAKNGIVFDKKPAQTPASRVAALHGDAGKVPVPNAGIRAVERSSSSTSSASMKPKKAPLMAKTLSFLKNRFRR